MEAKDLRMKQEQDRRRVQQRTRKEEMRMTHKKLVARGISKKMLVDLRRNVFRQLKDQGMLSDPLNQVM